MSSIYDYIDWRGDLTFSQDPFNEVDALIFSWLSYYRAEDHDFSEIDGLSLDELLALHEKKYGVLDRKDREKSVNTAVSSRYLLKALAGTERFKNTVIKAFSSHYDYERSIQFAAFSFGISKDIDVVAFRGTDTSVAGWKEDCRLCYEERIPAQKEAKEFLDSLSDGNKRIIIAGHSKGGNLSIYAAMNAEEEMVKRIDMIYNFDGPGFCFDMKNLPAYPALKEKVRSYLPPDSIVGILLEHVEDYSVVENSSIGIMQHFPVYWSIMGNRLVTIDERTYSSQMIDSIFSSWIRNISFRERKEFVESLFSVLERAGIEDFAELTTDSFQKIKAILSEMAGMDGEKRKMITSFLMDLMRTSGNSLIASIAEKASGRNNLLK